MNRKRLWLAAALLLLVLLAIAVLLANMIGANPRAVTLADGRRVTVRGISSGTSHRFVYGNFWQRIGALVLPSRWSARLGAATYREITGSPAHVVWAELPAASLPDVSKVWVADEWGTFIPARSLRPNRSGGNQIEPYMFFTMPTGSEKVEIIIDMGYAPIDLGSLANRRKLGGSVPFRNPSYLRRPKWRAKPLPIVVEQDELILHLDYFGPSREKYTMPSLEARDAAAKFQTNSGTKFDLAQNEQRVRTELVCGIQDRSNTNNEWRIDHVGLVNEIGSVWVPGSQESTLTRSNAVLRFTGWLSTNTLWKLRLFCTRRPDPAVDRLSNRSAPYERTIELIAQPTGGY